ncbi:hypothetical protein [Burkholderia stabilis]|uniref:DUF551 domain-containing protein n=1 Tax=Burkholderia stabilis TaxID=95485 RepID=A0AAJ5N7Q3_9BURK|nr:hypothetical protein [Burkholderia stabilis]VBB10668.1 hypothetical protein BSTAB16_0775 [Burkholderia stabilis]VBB13368.1 hypothetical protein BSTAB16_3553 [Burkholderia stabilis]
MTTENSRADALTAQAALAAIETFEIVGENNDSREPNADDRFILTEFIAHLFDGYHVEQPAAAPIEEMIRFCPECGRLGDIPASYEACCPDWSQARVVPKRFAELCAETFKLCVNQPYPQPAPAPADERAARAEVALRALADECENDAIAGWEERMQHRIDDAKRILARAASANENGEEEANELSERALLAASAWANSDTPLSEALAYRDGFIAGARSPAMAAEGAIYQILTEEDAWLDVSQSVYDRTKSDPTLTRVVYRTSVRAAHEVSDWQPIETAPKDGTQMLLSNGTDVEQGWWIHDEGGITEHRDLDGRYTGQTESEGYIGWWDVSGGMQPEPDRWMPMPEASAAAPQPPAQADARVPVDPWIMSYIDSSIEACQNGFIKVSREFLKQLRALLQGSNHAE